MRTTACIAAIAQVCYEANRAYCLTIGDDSQPAWRDSADWQVRSVINGVQSIVDGNVTGPGASHLSWLAEKERDGWVYGPEKIPALKQHPCMVPFDQLPLDQQAKDVLFFAI